MIVQGREINRRCGKSQLRLIIACTDSHCRLSLRTTQEVSSQVERPSYMINKSSIPKFLSKAHPSRIKDQAEGIYCAG